MKVTFDAADVQRVFTAYPAASTRKLRGLIEGGAIDTQRKMREKVNVGATGDGRRAIKYRLYPGQISAEIWPDFPYAEPLEKGSRPHWTSIKPGTSLYRWAKHKGFDEGGMRALQISIATKGTKPHPFVRPTYTEMKPRVERDIISGFGRFIQEVDSGSI